MSCRGFICSEIGFGTFQCFAANFRNTLWCHTLALSSVSRGNVMWKRYTRRGSCLKESMTKCQHVQTSRIRATKESEYQDHEEWKSFGWHDCILYHKNIYRIWCRLIRLCGGCTVVAVMASFQWRLYRQRKCQWSEVQMIKVKQQKLQINEKSQPSLGSAS